MEKTYPAIVEFYFGSYEESHLLQYIVKSEDDERKIYDDFMDSVKEALKEVINEYKGKLSISMEKIAYSKIDKYMNQKGWKAPDVAKTFYFDLWGEFDLINCEFKLFENRERKDKHHRDLDRMLAKALQELGIPCEGLNEEEINKKVEELKKEWKKING